MEAGTIFLGGVVVLLVIGVINANLPKNKKKDDSEKEE